MPRIFDNIENELAPALRETLQGSHRADFSVGYFNLRGWKIIDSEIEKFSGIENDYCRLLVGMGYTLDDELKASLHSLKGDHEAPDNKQLKEMQDEIARQFRKQLEFGIPTGEDEAGLQRLVGQLRAGKLKVKVFLRHSLHAKLYLCHRNDNITPRVGYLGSSNLTKSGLSLQGELNTEVTDNDAADKLAHWFEERWNDRCSLDITQALIDIIEESWAGPDDPPPYHIYLKMAYHLSQEARAGLATFAIPKDMQGKLLPFQEQAVLIAARHLINRGGVMLADVVGLGKTLMATALAKVIQEDYSYETLIICPKNLVPMWNDYRTQFAVNAQVMSMSMVNKELPDLKRFRLVIIDESHNLRNSDSRVFKTVQDYIGKNDSKCILLTATPYNKCFLDLGNQLNLFLDAEKALTLRPERLFRSMSATVFSAKHQCQPNTLKAFMLSDYTEDWQELMRLYMVRRTRSFIKTNYAVLDEQKDRHYMEFADDRRFYLPKRVPKTIKFSVDDEDQTGQYALMYSDEVVKVINRLHLPRYGLASYIDEVPVKAPTTSEKEQLANLTKAGQRLIGFCRTNLFKRLESSGQVFLLSLRSHLLRNFIFLYAIENGLDVPIGTLDAGIQNARYSDEDVDSAQGELEFLNEDSESEFESDENLQTADAIAGLKDLARQHYDWMRSRTGKRYKWLRSSLLTGKLAEHLSEDCEALISLLELFGNWDSSKDNKLKELKTLLAQHPSSKFLVFSQFADTVRYLYNELTDTGIDKLACVTGSSSNPTEAAYRFSPDSNEQRHRIKPEDEHRVLLTTDILSEGQNLQDCAIVVNFDIPWAIIRLIQRAGRVDRIGQKSDSIYCYTFLPAEGVENIILLRRKVQNRLRENALVIGTDEEYGFEDAMPEQHLRDLYTEKSSALDDLEDDDVDLTSRAYQIWKNASDADPKLKKIIPALPNVVYSTKQHDPRENAPTGVLLYMRTGEGQDALAWLDENGNSVTESQSRILEIAECTAATPAIGRLENHHELVAQGALLIADQARLAGGQLGNPRGARYRTYEKMSGYLERQKNSLFASTEELTTLKEAIQEIYNYPLTGHATDVLNRQMRLKAADHQLAESVLALRKDGRLCSLPTEGPNEEPQIICSMGLRNEVTD